MTIGQYQIKTFPRNENIKMLHLRKKRSFYPSQLEAIEQLGEKVGHNRKLNKVIIKANDFIGNNRKVVLPTIVLFTAAIVLLGILSTRQPHYDGTSLQEVKLLPSKGDLSNNFQEIIYDGINVSDSIKFLLDRGNLSYEDSLYITWGMMYINNITKATEQHEKEIQSQAQEN